MLGLGHLVNGRVAPELGATVTLEGWTNAADLAALVEARDYPDPVHFGTGVACLVLAVETLATVYRDGTPWHTVRFDVQGLVGMAYPSGWRPFSCTACGASVPWPDLEGGRCEWMPATERLCRDCRDEAEHANATHEDPPWPC